MTISRRWRPALLLAVGAVVAGLDLGTKFHVERHFSLGQRVALVEPWLWVTRPVHHNAGALLGSGRSWGASANRVLMTVSLAVAAGIFLWGCLQPAGSGPILTLAMGLILGGALGNGVDRAVAGGVSDIVMIVGSTRVWPAFNLADMAVFLGAGLCWLCAMATSSPSGCRAVVEGKVPANSDV